MNGLCFTSRSLHNPILPAQFLGDEYLIISFPITLKRHLYIEKDLRKTCQLLLLFYIYIYIYVCVCLYIYIHIYICMYVCIFYSSFGSE